MHRGAEWHALTVGNSAAPPALTFSKIKNDLVDGFTRKCGTHRLVWYEQHESVIEAITREKRIKKWNRDWKVNLIQAMNPEWRDLFAEIV